MGKDLQSFLRNLRETLPSDFVIIDKPVSPGRFDVTALLKNLESRVNIRFCSLRTRKT